MSTLPNKRQKMQKIKEEESSEKSDPKKDESESKVREEADEG